MTPGPNIFSGGLIDGASARIDANYVNPSHFIGRINAVKTGETRKSEGFFVVEMTVIEDLAPNEYDKGAYGHRAGEDVSHMMMSKHDSFAGNVKAFLKNVLGIPEGEIKDEHALAVCADDQPLENTIVEIVARETMTRANKPFTVVAYKGEVTATELIERWAERDDAQELADRFFPGGLLGKLAEEEAKAS